MLMISGVREWNVETASRLLMLGFGSTLVLLAIVIYGWSSKYLSKAAVVRHGIESVGQTKDID